MTSSDPSMAPPEASAGTVDAEEPTDEALAVDAREGNVRAFEMLLGRHESRVLRVLRLLGVPHADREDVAQEVFVRVFRHLGGFRTGHTFSGWIYRITVNAAHDFRRRLARRRPEMPWAEDQDSPYIGPGPFELTEQRARMKALEEALACLSERERAVFVLSEIEGLETRAIARSLGISTITIRRHLSRSRRHLRRLLGEGEGDD